MEAKMKLSLDRQGKQNKCERWVETILGPRWLADAFVALTEDNCDPITTVLRQTRKIDFGTLSVDGNGLI
jgi:hypothetical protein